MINFLKQLFCKHDYEYTGKKLEIPDAKDMLYASNYGTSVRYDLYYETKCKKCGKKDKDKYGRIIR